MPAKAKLDVLLEAGNVHVINIPHPTIAEVKTEAYVDNATYPRNKPGIISFCQAVMRGEIAPEHEGRTLLDIAQILFADVVDERGSDFVTNAVSSVDEAAKSAAKAAKLHAWRGILEAMDVQTAARELYKLRETKLAELAKVEADVDAMLTATADALELDKTFDLALLETGIYLPEQAAKTVGERNEVDRKWDKNTYEWAGTLHGKKGKAVAKRTKVNKDDPSCGNWTVTYTFGSETFVGKVDDDSLNAANVIAREAFFVKHAPKASRANNAPGQFKVK